MLAHLGKSPVDTLRSLQYVVGDRVGNTVQATIDQSMGCSLTAHRDGDRGRLERKTGTTVDQLHCFLLM